MLDGDLITRTLDIAAERCPDPAPLVYARLFADQPDLEPLFVRDKDGSVKGEMLARVFEMILDFIDERSYGARMIQCEVVTHDGYGVPPTLFGTFFSSVAETVRDLAGGDWTPQMSEAWKTLLGELNWYVDHPDQTLPAPLA